MLIPIFLTGKSTENFRKLGSKVPYALRMVGLGTDAMTVNMLEEVRAALWLQHLKRDPSQGFMEAAQALLVNNAKIANRCFKGLGELKEGFAADLAIMDYLPPPRRSTRPTSAAI